MRIIKKIHQRHRHYRINTLYFDLALIIRPLIQQQPPAIRSIAKHRPAIVSVASKKRKLPTIYYHYHKVYHHFQHRVLSPYYIRLQITTAIHPMYRRLQQIVRITNTLRTQAAEPFNILQIVRQTLRWTMIAVIFVHEIKNMLALNLMVICFLRIASVRVSCCIFTFWLIPSQHLSIVSYFSHKFITCW